MATRPKQGQTLTRSRACKLLGTRCCLCFDCFALVVFGRWGRGITQCKHFQLDFVLLEFPEVDRLHNFHVSQEQQELQSYIILTEMRSQRIELNWIANTLADTRASLQCNKREIISKNTSLITNIKHWVSVIFPRSCLFLSRITSLIDRHLLV